MSISSHYPAILARAIDLLRTGQINNYPWDDLRHDAAGDGRNAFAVRNAVGCALCKARDEAWDTEHARRRGLGHETTNAEIREAYRTVGFTPRQHELARDEIIRQLCAGAKEEV